MAKTIVTSDLHIGHRAICMYRTQFATVEEHDDYKPVLFATIMEQFQDASS